MQDGIYAEIGVLPEEFHVRVSDHVELKVIDFKSDTLRSDAPVFVFVAGWISLVKGWVDVLRVMTAQYRVLYIETREKISAVLPGKKQVEFSIHRMSQDLDDLLPQILPPDTDYYFAGSSLGSTVVLHYLTWAERQPEKSILISPVCEFAIPGWGLTMVRWAHPSLYTAIKPLVKWYLKNFRLDKKNEPEQVAKYEGTLDAAEPRRLKANALAIFDYNLWDELPYVKSPVVIVGAETDRLHSIDMLEKMVSMMPSAELELMQSNKETHSGRAGDLMVQHVAGHEKRNTT